MRGRQVHSRSGLVISDWGIALFSAPIAHSISGNISRHSPEANWAQTLLTIILDVSMTTGNCSRLAALVLYNIEVANAMAQRCKETTFVGKESRFFTMVFFPRPRFPYIALKTG
jgi:hypothetical protein